MTRRHVAPSWPPALPPSYLEVCCYWPHHQLSNSLQTRWSARSRGRSKNWIRSRNRREGQEQEFSIQVDNAVTEVENNVEDGVQALRLEGDMLGLGPAEVEGGGDNITRIMANIWGLGNLTL